jgi:small subunit ribosomal protein S21
MATSVRAQPGEPIDILIRKFNRKVQTEGILTDLKKHEYFLKPSARKRHEFEIKRKKTIRKKSM